MPDDFDCATGLAGNRGHAVALTAWHHLAGNIITLTLYVQPGARHSAVVGLHGDALKIRLAEPAIEGRANEALLRFIADSFNVPLNNVELKRGAQSRHKTVMVRDSEVNPESLLPLDRQ